MSSPAELPIELFLDLGDAFTKASWVDGTGAAKRFRFPSVVARSVLAEDRSELSLGPESFPSPVGFEAHRFPRTRSYPGTARVLDTTKPVEGARFAGWLAAKVGADRQLLGEHPTKENVEALVRKSLLATGVDRGRVRITFVVDAGPKAQGVLEHARGLRRVLMTAWRLGHDEPRRVDLEVEHRIADAPTCVADTLPQRVAIGASRRVLLVDVGYLRTKLAVISAEGCELWRELAGMGVGSCVRRLLRDGREQGLVEDELAVVRALERSQHTLEIGGRRHEVGPSFDDAVRGLAEDLERAVGQAIVAHYERRGEPCRAVAVVGGGSAVVGPLLAARLERADLGLGAPWLAPDPGFLPVEGARRIEGRRGASAAEREANRV